MICPRCRKNIQEGIDFCTFCGCRIPQKNVLAVQKVNPSKKRLLICIVSVLIIVIATMIIFDEKREIKGTWVKTVNLESDWDAWMPKWVFEDDVAIQYIDMGDQYSEVCRYPYEIQDGRVFLNQVHGDDGETADLCFELDGGNLNCYFNNAATPIVYKRE